MRKFTLFFVSVLVTLSMLLSACGTSASPSSDTAPTPAAGATNTPGATSAPEAATTEVPPASYPNPEASYPNDEPQGTIGVPGVFALFHILTAWVDIK